MNKREWCRHPDCVFRWEEKPEGVPVLLMRRLYVRKLGGRGYIPAGWICPKGHVVLEGGTYPR